MSEKKWTTMINAYGLSLISKGTDIAYFLLLVSLLTKNELGQFNELMSISLFFLTFIDFGISQAGLRGFSQGRVDIRHALQRALPIRLLMLGLALAILACGYFWNSLSASDTLALAWLGVYQVLNITHLLLLDGIRGKERQTAANQIITAESILKLVALVIIKMVFTKIDTMDVIGALLIVKIIVLAQSFRVVVSFPREKTGEENHANLFNPILFEGQWSLLGVALLTVIQNRLSWLMVSNFMNADALATYSVVSRYFEILLFVLGIGFSTLYPWLCKAAESETKKADHRSLRTLRQLQFLPVPILVAAALVTFPWINSLFWGGRYQDAVEANLWLLPCAGLAVGNMMMYYDLMANRREHLLIFVCGGATLLQTLFNFWAIPHWGMPGAIGGIWVMNFANVIFYAIACYRRVYSPKEVAFTTSSAIAISTTMLIFVNLLSATSILSIFIPLTGIATLAVWRARNYLFSQQPRATV